MSSTDYFKVLHIENTHTDGEDSVSITDWTEFR